MRYENELVRIELTTTKDTYHGMVVGTDEQFVYLADYTYGWYGEAGFWKHGTGKEIALPIATIRTIKLHKGQDA